MKSPLRSFIFCEICNYKQIVENDEVHLKEIQQSKIQGHIPQLDPLTKKTTNSEEKKRSKKYKCPRCGRGVILKLLPAPYKIEYKKQEIKAELERSEKDRIQRIKDSQPPEERKQHEEKSNDS